MKLTALNFKNGQKGFTLIELLVVIGILAILLAITLIAINPAKQFAQANNTQRASDVNTILNAINQYMSENNGQLPPAGAGGIPVAPAAANEISDVGADLCTVLVPEYIAALPVDPQSGTGDPIEAADCAAAYATGYEVVQSAGSNRITVSAPDAELGQSISVTR
jgi:prepilin-type N-terminal cleavage/methylation domain-containing protein